MTVQRTGIPDVTRGDLGQHQGSSSSVRQRKDQSDIFRSHESGSEGTNAFDRESERQRGGFVEKLLHQNRIGGEIELVHPFVGKFNNVWGAGVTIHSQRSNQDQ